MMFTFVGPLLIMCPLVIPTPSRMKRENYSWLMNTALNPVFFVCSYCLTQLLAIVTLVCITNYREPLHLAAGGNEKKDSPVIAELK